MNRWKYSFISSALCQFSNANIVLQYSQKRGIEDFIIENILDRLVVQILVSCHEEFHDLHAAFLAQVELSVGMGILAAVLRCTAQGVVRVFLFSQ